ncbi:MAG: diguanylate cyclase, partial [Pusillimonas sp.]|nr:diguanylate cyclase [Pusillimonas sp.]
NQLMMNYASVSVLGLVTFAAITLFYHHHAYGWLRSVATRQIALGGLFGLGTILLMLHSKEVSSGLLLDARVLLMGYAGLLAGWRGATIALTLAVSARLLIGGQGLLIGCLTLTVAPLIGLAWRHLVGRITVSSTWHYLGFGVALSLSLVTIALFPAPHAANPLSAVPGLIAVNIIGSLLAGYMELGIQETAIHRGEIQRLAMTDELTGLNNRLSFNQHISQRLTELKTPFQPFALISLDIDNFRNINSTLGHKVGDQLLVSIAGNLQQAVKHEETLARIEGDEFVVLMPCSSITEAFSRAEQLLNVIRMPHKIDHYVIMTTASAGISWATKHDLDSRVLLQDAEIAMYQSKRKGRNHSTAFEEKMRFDVERTSKLTHALQQALVSAEGLRIVFQPQVSLIDGSVA